ncbi:Polycomb eed-A [Brachionus plicatilis]|uniref:Polycomb eed-A n=1 Tax=Brachionus plicatilis TaxID=10195 RepID=A0A3M7SPM4_BRAPC|nr:Polycomb eed-A [Brachionus plicatilis]
MKSSFEKSDYSTSNKKSPKKMSTSPNVTTRSRSLLNLSNSESESPNIKRELKIEIDREDHYLNPNLPSTNSSDFSVVYVDDSDDTNQSQEAKNEESRKDAQNKIKKNTFSSDQKKSKYKFVNMIKEEHEDDLNIYDVKIYRPFEENPKNILFASVGSNQCSFYEYNTSTAEVEPIDIYLDADPQENFFVCAWTIDPDRLEPLLAIAGLKGIIRTISPFKSQFKNALIGHGASINDLKFHPSQNFILLSASKDHTLRLWNINTTVCIAIFGGAEGHTDQVLSTDIDLQGRYIISCGIDHFLKIWSIQTPKLKNAIDISEEFDNTYKSFPTVSVNFPDFSTRDVHTNYVDCVRWFGDLILSKSCENCIIEWKPGLINEKMESLSRTSKNVFIFNRFEAKECDIWFVRFGLDFSHRVMAVGTTNGKVYVWKVDTENSNDFSRISLSNQKMKGIIRSIALSFNGNDLIITNNLGNIFIWRKE